MSSFHAFAKCGRECGYVDRINFGCYVVKEIFSISPKGHEPPAGKLPEDLSKCTRQDSNVVLFIMNRSSLVSDESCLVYLERASGIQPAGYRTIQVYHQHYYFTFLGLNFFSELVEVGEINHLKNLPVLVLSESCRVYDSSYQTWPWTFGKLQDCSTT